MNSQLHQLAFRIRDALAEIEYVQRRIQSGWQRVQHSNDDHYLDGEALNLHGFCSGLERIFELVATRFVIPNQPVNIGIRPCLFK